MPFQTPEIATPEYWIVTVPAGTHRCYNPRTMMDFTFSVPARGRYKINLSTQQVEPYRPDHVQTAVNHHIERVS